MQADQPTTAISKFNEGGATIRGYDLVSELIGHISFSEMIYLYVMGTRPTAEAAAMFDAILVTMVDHGVPAGLTARLTLRSAPESLQGAVAAGLLGVGSQYGGVMENAGQFLQQIVHNQLDLPQIEDIVRTKRAAKEAVPGFGHPDFRPIDPRAQRLLDMATTQGLAGEHVAALKQLSQAVDAVVGKPVTINVTGAIGAILADMGLPPRIMRGISLIARTPGLVGQLKEEMDNPIADHFQGIARRDVTYAPSNNR
jgi:citrate synthase